MDKISQIKSVITDFIKGGDDRNIQLLTKVMHPGFQNTQDGFFKEKGIFTFSKPEYIHLIESKQFGGSPRSIEFVSLDDLGNMAVAKVLLESEFLKFTSYIVAVSDGTDWQVINNIPKIEMKITNR